MMAFEARFLAVLLINAVLLVNGCTLTRVATPDPGRVDGWVAAMVGAATMTRTVLVPPKPEPKPDGTKCANCGGTGVLPGDGVTKPKCPECGGDGVKAKSVPKVVVPVKPKVATKKLVPAPKQQVTGGCTGGSCSGQRPPTRFRR